ncbi:MAG TPA: hypothetical protein VFX30_09110 [bacterium]|nr:hypothetical protein [bacterium]
MSMLGVKEEALMDNAAVNLGVLMLVIAGLMVGGILFMGVQALRSGGKDERDG